MANNFAGRSILGWQRSELEIHHPNGVIWHSDVPAFICGLMFPLAASNILSISSFIFDVLIAI